MELLLVFVLFCLSKNHRRGFSHYENASWNQVFFINEDERAQLYVDGYPVGMDQSGMLYFPPECQQINVQYMIGDQVLLASELKIRDQKTIFMADWNQARLLRVK